MSHFATDSTYQGTGWTLMRKSKFSEPVEKGPQTAYQAVFDLPSPAAARKLLDGLIPAWEACHGQAYTGEWFMRDLTVHDDMMVSVSVDQDSTTGWSCQHVIAVAAHYVVEARACGRGSGQGEAMAQRILAKIPT